MLWRGNKNPNINGREILPKYYTAMTVKKVSKYTKIRL